MLRVINIVPPAAAVGGTLTLPFEQRQKSRLHAVLDDGTEVGLFLPRGSVLRGGDCLQAEDGLMIEVRAAAEPVSTARAEDPLLLARACYHLGNRHVALQIGRGWLRYLHDHVLDGMVVALGLSVCFEEAPFEPEAGAYQHEHTSPGHHAHAHPHHHHD